MFQLSFVFVKFLDKQFTYGYSTLLVSSEDHVFVHHRSPTSSISIFILYLEFLGESNIFRVNDMRKAVLFGQATEARQALLTINRCYSVVILRNHLKPDGFKSYIINKRLTMWNSGCVTSRSLIKNSKLLSALTSERAAVEDLARFTVPIINIQMIPSRRLINCGNQELVDFAKTCCVCFVSRFLILGHKF